MSQISLSISKQAGIVNYKAAQTQSSGITAVHVITPTKDSVTGLLILASQSPGLNRVYFHPATELTPRGITESAAQAKYIADVATLKTYFGLSNAGDSASSSGLPQVRLDDAGKVYWDTQLSAFPTASYASTAAENKVSSDGNHLWLNYFNPATGTFDAVPFVPKITGNTEPKEKTLLGLTGKQWTIGGIIGTVLAFIIWDPKKMIWSKGKSKSKATRYS